MAHNHRWLNRIRLNVHLLESRIQPGSWFTTGLVDTSAFGAGLLTPPQNRPQVSVTQQETFGPSPWHGQETVPQPGSTVPQLGSTLDTVAHPDQLLRAALFADTALADPLGASPRSRLVRQRADVSLSVHPTESADGMNTTAPITAGCHAHSFGWAWRSHPCSPRAVSMAPNVMPVKETSEAQKQSIAEDYGRLPLSFEQNVGQFDDRVDFVARAGDMTTFLTPTAAVFVVQNSESGSQNPERTDARHGAPYSVHGTQNSDATGVALHMQIVNGNPDAQAKATDKLPGIVNYFIGNDPSQWHTNIATFGRVEYQDVYPGIDLAYYGNNGALEYDFIVSPGADPNVIALNFAGSDGVEVDPHGNLLLHTAAGDVVQQKPLTYQQEGGSRQEIASRYVVDGTSVRFEVGAYDPTQPLVIDPLVLGWSTYLGGSGGDDFSYAISVDAAGHVFATGYTHSAIFPTTPGAFDISYNGLPVSSEAFVSKFSADGKSLIYSTFLGGSSEDDAGSGIAVDVAGNAYVTGTTYSGDFPTTAGAFDTSPNGGLGDAFVAKLSASGTNLVYGSYLGGSSDDLAYGITVDGAGNAYVTGRTNSTNFPTTPGAFDTSYNDDAWFDAFVSKLSAEGTSLGYSTFLGGAVSESGNAIAVDAEGSVYVTGYTHSSNFPTTTGAFDNSFNGFSDAFAVKLGADGANLVYSTYLGGSTDDVGNGLAIDTVGNAYVVGFTLAANFPATQGAFDTSHNGDYDAFVAKLSPGGTNLRYATYVGGSGLDVANGMAVDAAGNAHLIGYTRSQNFPTTPQAFDTSFNGNPADVFLAKLSADGMTLDYGTYFGGSGEDAAFGMAVDAAGNAYVTGLTRSADFPTTPGAFKRRNRGGYDAFVTKFAEV